MSWSGGHAGTRITTQRQNGLLDIRLAHPPVNALDADSYREIREVFVAISSDETIGVVLLSGGKGGFSAGQDTNDASAISENPERYLLDAAAALTEVTTCPAIVIAAVSGFAVGAGLILASAADYLIIDEAARLSLPELAYGVCAGPAHLTRWLGSPGAEQALLSGESIDAHRFTPLGAILVNPREVEQQGYSHAQHLASRAPALLRGTKSTWLRDRREIAKRYQEEIRISISSGRVDFSSPR